MAKMFYSAKEASERLGRSEEDLKALVRDGKLREFRDAGSVNYKVSDVDGLASKAPAKSAKPAPAPASFGGSQSGEIVLEPVEDSSVELAPSASDVVSLEGVDAEDTAIGARIAKKAKEGSAVASVGVNVFDDDDLDEHVDPLAQTAVTDVAGLEGIGSGSGILDLTRESDDTSLGAELLEEIYTGEEGEAVGGEGAAPEMGDATRAGLDEALPAAEAEGDEAAGVGTTTVVAAKPRAVVTQVIEYAPDAMSNSLTAALVVAVAVMWFGGLGAAALVRGVTPAILRSVNDNLMVFAGGSLLVCGLAAGVAYFLAKRSR